MATTPTLIESYERPRRIWPLLVIALTVLFYFRTMVLLQKVPNLSDIRSYYYPLWKFFSGSLRTGSLPFWVPGIYCGFPLFADSEMGLAYPLNMLLLRLPVTAGFNYSLIIHYLLGGWFTYAYCRRLRLSRPASVFAAIPFILGGFFISHLVHPNVVATAAWLPLFLYCLERALEERRMSFFIACGGVMGLQFLSGFLMIPLIEAVMGFFYMLFYPRGEGEGFMASLPFRLGGFALALGLGAGLGMIQNLPSYYLVQNSFRSGGLSPSVSNMGSLPPAQLLGLVFPRAFGRGVAMGSYVGAWTFEETYSYIGLLPLLFASMALLRPRRWHAIFFAAVGFLSLLLSLGNQGLLWRLLRLLPGFSVLKGSSRFLLTFNFAAAVLGAMGFDRWRQGHLERKARRALSRFWTIAAAAVGGGILVVTLLYHFNPLDFRDFLAAVFGHLSSGIKQSPHRVLQALQDFFTTPRMEFLVPLLMVVIFLFLLRKAGRGHRPGRGLAAMVVGMAVLDVLIFSSFIYGFVPRAKAEYVPPVVDILSNESAGGRVAMLKEPGVNRGDFPLCPNLLLPEKVNDAFGFSTIPPSRLDRFLALLDQHPDIAAYEQLGVSLLFSNLVRIGGMPYELGTPHYITRGLSAKRYVYPDMVGEQLRLIVDGTVMEPNAYGSLHIILIANSKTGSTPLAVLRLDKESGEDAEVDMVSGEARVFMHRVSFSSPGYGSGRLALEIRLTMKEIINAEELTVATFCEEDLEDTRILALDAVDRRSNALPLTTLSIAYLDRDFVVYRTPEPRPLAYHAWDPVWVESWRKAVDATWQGEAKDGKIYLLRGEVDDQLRSKLNGLEPPGPDAAVTRLEEGKDRLVLRSRNDRDSILVISLDYLPGWKASVDGRPTRIFSANGFFSAVFVEAGEHQIELSYTQPGLVAGGAISSISLIMLAILFVLARRKEAAFSGACPSAELISPPSKGSISAFFPCYNDSATLKPLVEKALQVLSELCDDYEVIIVDDGSEDDSGALADELSARYPRVRVVHHPRNRGYGGALRSGISATTKDWVFYTDSDGQYDVEDLRLLWSMSGQADVVNGYKRRRSDPWYRVLLGSVYNFGIRHLFAIPIRDVDCDFRLMKGDLARGLELKSEGGSICVEMIKGLQVAGAVFAETAVSHYPRQSGKSQFFRLKNVVAMAGGLLSLWWRMVFVSLRGKRERA